MNILGIDTSTKKANVCIKKDTTIFDKSINNEITHSEKLLPLVDESLKEANIKLNEINYLACSIGPGSFTGIRIGLSTVKAFAKVINVPIFAVSSLDVLAYTNIDDSSNYIISIMDAKNFRIYYAVYKVINKGDLKYLQRLSEYKNDVIDNATADILNTLKNENDVNSIKIVGDCASNYENTFKSALSSICETFKIYNEDLSGKVLVNMLNDYITLGIDKNYQKDYLTLDALYVRPSQAERAKKDEL